MARSIRVEFEGAYYHLMARGNERRSIFWSDLDRHLFLDTLQEMLSMYHVRLLCYCLMPNHYHLVVQTPYANLSRSLLWLQTTYTVRFNRRHRRSGHLFQGRYRAHVVDADEYAIHLVRYIHLNPIRPRDKCSPIPAERLPFLEQYTWSSHRDYAGFQEAPGWLNTQWLSYWGRSKKEAQSEYRKDISESCGRPMLSLWNQSRGGLALVGEELWGKVCEMVQAKAYDEEVRWSEQQEHSELQRRVRDMATLEKDPRVQMWLRACVGGERRVDVARDFGYRDGRGVLQALRRLNLRAKRDPTLAAKLEALRKSVECGATTP